MEQGKEIREIAESPFKKFWDKKKELISFTGIVIAIGSMFLRVPVPDQNKAAEALGMIQFLSIFVMSIAIVWLWFSFLSFSYRVESHLSKKSGINLENTLSNGVFMLIFYFVYNLWIYTISLYKIEWQKFFNSLQATIGVIIIALIIYLTDKIYNIKEKISWFQIIIRLLGSSLLISLLPIIWSLFSKLQFVFKDSLKSYLRYILFYFIIAIAMFLIRVYKDKKNKDHE